MFQKVAIPVGMLDEWKKNFKQEIETEVINEEPIQNEIGVSPKEALKVLDSVIARLNGKQLQDFKAAIFDKILKSKE